MSPTSLFVLDSGKSTPHLKNERNDELNPEKEGKPAETIYTNEENKILAASISDPYICLRLENGQAVMFVGDMITRSISRSEDLSEEVSRLDPALRLC